MERQAALSGTRILDLTRMMAGPFCTSLLADVGAEVIKVETPGVGDDARAFPPTRGGESCYFMLLNRGKESITLNLKSPEGADLFRRLARKCDVVVENYKPGVSQRLGIDYQSLKDINPRLVYASISGFGQDGPLAHRPAYDIIAQAMGGIMSITGMPDGPPTRVGESVGDLIAGLYGAWGIVVALAARERTGRGQHVDVAMVDAIFSLLITAMTQHLYDRITPRRVGNRHPMTTPYDSYRARDGYVIIAVANNPMFERFAAAIGRPELARDPRFVTDDERTRHEPELRAIIEEWSRARTVDEVVAGLETASVPASPIWTVAEIAASAHVKHRDMLAEVEHPTAGRITVLQEPVRFSLTERRIQGPSPLLGQHTETVLAELAGVEPGALARLRREGVV
ncbi:MAG: CaiB/BaiF CoA transferase family protein [Pseudomonadota bacterium]